MVLVELGSGIDALYLSGRCHWSPVDFLDRLDRAREEAEITGVEVPISVGDAEFRLQAHGFGRYRYKLTHQHGTVGVSPSVKLPILRIQPQARFIHGVGAMNVVDWFRKQFQAECDEIELTASRIDLHADWQGWDLRGDDRSRFVCRSDDLVMYEFDDLFTGFIFGRRKNKTIEARIYDKTREMRKTGAGYLEDHWGERFDPQSPVLRVEFEFGRQGLAEFGIRSPEDAIEASGALWSYATEKWLSLRVPTSDSTRSRWPVAPEWDRIRRASVADSAIGLERVYDGYRRGKSGRLVTSLVGYVVSYAAFFGIDTAEEVCERLVDGIEGSCNARGLSFKKRVVARRREFGLS